MMINIKEMNKADVLAKLYNASHQQGFGFLDPDGQNSMTTKQAQDILDSGQTYFDYLRGRVMKIDLSQEELDPRLYDRDNGAGAAETALSC